MPDCGSQAVLCDMPIRFDTFSGCTHGCEYCFIQKKVDLKDVNATKTVKALKNFIEGRRSKSLNWCDWDIPIHFDGMSDPLQPIERKAGATLACFELLADTQYPIVLSTKGHLLVEEPYKSLIGRMNVVVQISAVASEFDDFELGCPTFEGRMEMAREIAPIAKRLIMRVQPYCLGLRKQLVRNVDIFKEVGAFGMTIEGMKRQLKGKGFVPLGNDWVYPLEPLKKDFLAIRERCREVGLEFWCAENRLRALGKDSSCCGAGGVEGFAPNKANLSQLAFGNEIPFTEQMSKPGTGYVFKTLKQDQEGVEALSQLSFKEVVEIASKSKTFREVMNLPEDGSMPLPVIRE